MKKITIEPLVQVNGVKFGCDRESARKIFGNKYKEIKKNKFSKNTMDSYKDFHVYYSEDGLFEAIEIFGKVKVIVAGYEVFPGKVDNSKKVFPEIHKDDDDWIDEKTSIGITVMQDDHNSIEAILFGCKGYYYQQ
ncbi:hypothetical protein [Butyrivibrio sp. VCD2006]|uniref:hypothetical protein n=1 Tax=Butyrivibrio sp. VCD2006 TaxID=1280664 RepID=UPI000424C4A7|nr:hypothetical protein [Butyrivibrio sp. VCD2006]